MLKYWLWLTTLPGLGLKEQTQLLRQFETAEEIYFADGRTLSLAEGLSQETLTVLENKSTGEAERILNYCYTQNIRIITMQDAEYPNRLRAIDQPPPVLYCRGRMLPFDTEPVIAVVGTRGASAYGLRSAKRLGYQIGRCGGTVISGMAKGIDAAAMEGALSADAPVAGVLGCGVDVVYPRENASLFRDVARWGCLLSEYPPGTPPLGRNFPVRNRLLSALALGTLVVEAPAHSGALITASHALEQGRDVYAVPGSIDSPSSEGTNQLIRDGAMLVTSGWDVMRDYSALFPGKIDYHPAGQLELTPEQARAAEQAEKQENAADEKKSQKKTTPDTEKSLPETPKMFDNEQTKPYIELDAILSGLSGDERTLAALLGEGPLTADELIAESQLPAANVMASLTLLEVQGVVRCGADKRFSLTGQHADND